MRAVLRTRIFHCASSPPFVSASRLCELRRIERQLAQSLAGQSAYNTERLSHRQPTLSWVAYVGSSDFWNRTLQNWQSEFLALGSMAIFAVYLRQRGSPESKPVGAPHDATGVES